MCCGLLHFYCIFNIIGTQVWHTAIVVKKLFVCGDLIFQCLQQTLLIPHVLLYGKLKRKRLILLSALL